MKEFLDGLIAQGYVRRDVPAGDLCGGIVLVAAVVIFGFVLNVAGVTTFIERRVWARISRASGPNRVGPQGILQWLAGRHQAADEGRARAAACRSRACSRWRRTSSSSASSPPSSRSHSAARSSPPI
jgi:hypothetical protein